METYSTTERLASKAQSSFEGVSNGTGILTMVVILSGILSAIFFWQNSRLVFADVYPPLAIVLGLAVGLIPAEGAFFGWRRIRATKHDLTAKQLAATTAGIVTSVGCSIFSTFSLFVASFQYVPVEIAQYTNWFVFLALSLPVIIQVIIFASFSINDRATIENYERGKLGAMGFNAYIRAEQARMQAVIDGMDQALDAQLEAYGQSVGAGEAGKLLTEGSRALLTMGDNGRAQEQTAVNTAVNQAAVNTAVTPATNEPKLHNNTAANTTNPKTSQGDGAAAYFSWLNANASTPVTAVTVENLNDIEPNETANGKAHTVNPTQRPGA